MLSEQKRCGRCKETKTAAEFHRHSGRQDGLYPMCKACVRTENRRYKQSHKESVARYYARWRALNMRYDGLRKQAQHIIKRGGDPPRELVIELLNSHPFIPTPRGKTNGNQSP